MLSFTLQRRESCSYMQLMYKLYLSQSLSIFLAKVETLYSLVILKSTAMIKFLMRLNPTSVTMGSVSVKKTDAIERRIVLMAVMKEQKTAVSLFVLKLYRLHNIVSHRGIIYADLYATCNVGVTFIHSFNYKCMYVCMYVVYICRPACVSFLCRVYIASIVKCIYMQLCQENVIVNIFTTEETMLAGKITTGTFQHGLK